MDVRSGSLTNMSGGSNPSPVRKEVGAVDVLICFAVREEARFVAAPAKPVTDVLITGIGVRNASTALQDYLSRRAPRVVLTCGFAGGLNPVHRLGQILFDITHAGPFRHRFPLRGMKPGRFVHSDRVVVRAEDKARLFETSGADAVEMESSAIVNLCLERSLPVMVVRAILDTAQEDLPMDFNQFSRPDGDLSLPRLLLGIVRSPSSIPKLVGFRSRLKLVAEKLGATLEELLASSDLF